jgi:archaellum component FlaG (FlaF/FlaG flagellin family)
MPNNIKLLKWSELFSKSLPTDKSVAILTEGNATAQDRTDVIEALNLDQTDVSFNVVVVDEAYSVNDEDTYVICETGSGTYAITLPSANSKKIVYVKNTGDDEITVIPISEVPGGNIDGLFSFSLLSGDSVKFVSDGEANWYTFARYVAPVA